MPGGGRLTVETANATNDVPAAVPDVHGGRFVRLTVTDTGTGMPPDVAERAFEPFFTTRGPGTATGLGLATVYGIAHQAGGTATLWSRPDSGTIVQVDLPAVTASAGSYPHADGAYAGQARTVLVVDDENDVREVVRRTLSRHGYQPLTAGSAAEALQLWQDRARHIDALITDLVMPGTSGEQLARQLRQERPDLPVLFISGYTG